MMTAHPTIPSAYGLRKRLWINSSLWLGVNERPYAALAIQNLGYAERLLLEMELRLTERNRLLPECSAHSALWIFGLYEVLRLPRIATLPDDEMSTHFSMLDVRWSAQTQDLMTRHGVSKRVGSGLS